VSYNTIVKMAQDLDLRLRLIAAAAQEQDENPADWVDRNRWNIVARSDWNAAYEYAVLTGNPTPGHDEGVITDPMILSAVQARIADIAATQTGPQPAPEN